MSLERSRIHEGRVSFRPIDQIKVRTMSLPWLLRPEARLGAALLGGVAITSAALAVSANRNRNRKSAAQADAARVATAEATAKVATSAADLDVADASGTQVMAGSSSAPTDPLDLMFGQPTTVEQRRAEMNAVARTTAGGGGSGGAAPRAETTAPPVEEPVISFDEDGEPSVDPAFVPDVDATGTARPIDEACATPDCDSAQDQDQETDLASDIQADVDAQTAPDGTTVDAAPSSSAGNAMPAADDIQSEVDAQMPQLQDMLLTGIQATDEPQSSVQSSSGAGSGGDDQAQQVTLVGLPSSGTGSGEDDQAQQVGLTDLLNQLGGPAVPTPTQPATCTNDANEASTGWKQMGHMNLPDPSVETGMIEMCDGKIEPFCTVRIGKQKDNNFLWNYHKAHCA